MKFNIEDFKKGKFAILCPTLESAIWFDDFCDKFHLPKECEHYCSKVWQNFEENTCFAIYLDNGIGYSSFRFYNKEGLPVYNACDLDDYGIYIEIEDGKCILPKPNNASCNNNHNEICQGCEDSDRPIDPKPDMVNHPQHYQGKYECIDLMIAMFGMESVKSFCKCNSFKYRFRADRKNGAEDIKKAEWYEDKLMELNKQSVPTRKVIRYRKRRKNDSNIN